VYNISERQPFEGKGVALERRIQVELEIPSELKKNTKKHAH
jgi:hypothetical protein